MNKEIRDFIDQYKFKPLPKITVKEWIKDHNHEIWQKCICGNEEDLRKKWICSVCGTILYKPS